MKVDVLLGLQWGDEGKGKIVDVLSSEYDIVARYQGGPNAGHTLIFDNQKHVLHTIPSGIFNEDTFNIIGNGVVIDPVTLVHELQNLEKHNIDYKTKIIISSKAHIILPTHKLLDKMSEQLKGEKKIGSTLKGIGPTYMDKTGRNGLRIGDIINNDFSVKYNNLKEKHIKLLNNNDFDLFDLELLEKEWFESVEIIKNLEIRDTEYYFDENLKSNKRILAEGAQGTMLDINFGSYPYVTSSDTVTAGVCTGLGISPQKIGKVYGIFKAYCTRVGSGPFPTELDNEIGEKIREIGKEYGATTGRNRRCGWLDLPALKYSIMINGVTDLCMMKSDVLDSFEDIYVCTHYKIDENIIDKLPFDITNINILPIYKCIKAWNTPTNNIDKFSDFPIELKNYIHFLETELNCKIKIVSLGPDRMNTVLL